MNYQEAKLLRTVWVQASPAVQDGTEPTSIGEMAQSIGISAGEAQRLAQNLQREGYWTLWYSHDPDGSPIVQFTQKGNEFLNRPPTR